MTDPTHGIDLETLLSRTECAAALTRAGYRVAPATLATKATRGGGPPFCLYGNLPRYRWADALHWARSRVTPTFSTTRDVAAYRATMAAA